MQLIFDRSGKRVENENEGWEEWRKRVRVGGVENESEGWGEWRMGARDAGVENESVG